MSDAGGIPAYPDFAPVSLDVQQQVQSALAQTTDPLSEYTFASLFVFRHKYQYRVSTTSAGDVIISGVHATGDGGQQKFFMTPLGFPDRVLVSDLFTSHDYWRGITSDMLADHGTELASWGVVTTPDRDDFDYLHLRSDLAELHGDKYQKKRNLINSFESEFNCEARELTPEEHPAALSMLEAWCADKGKDADYLAAIDALEQQSDLGLIGRIYFIDSQPVGWWLGETLPQQQTFVEHFEKARHEFSGLYQFVNRDMALSLPESVEFINREQDLGDEGLRQAKMSYHPLRLIEKYVGTVATKVTV